MRQGRYASIIQTLSKLQTKNKIKLIKINKECDVEWRVSPFKLKSSSSRRKRQREESGSGRLYSCVPGAPFHTINHGPQLVSRRKVTRARKTSRWRPATGDRGRVTGDRRTGTASTVVCCVQTQPLLWPLAANEWNRQNNAWTPNVKTPFQLVPFWRCIFVVHARCDRLHSALFTYLICYAYCACHIDDDDFLPICFVRVVPTSASSVGSTFCTGNNAVVFCFVEPVLFVLWRARSFKKTPFVWLSLHLR